MIYCVKCPDTHSDEYGYCKNCGLPVLDLDKKPNNHEEFYNIFLEIIEETRTNKFSERKSHLPALAKHHNPVGFIEEMREKFEKATPVCEFAKGLSSKRGGPYSSFIEFAVLGHKKAELPYIWNKNS